MSESVLAAELYFVRPTCPHANARRLLYPRLCMHLVSRFIVILLVASTIACAHSRKPSAASVDAVENELMEASERARGRLLTLKPQYEQLKAEGAELFVKVPLPAEEGTVEWVWANVSSWKATIQAVLANEPVIATYVPPGTILEIEENGVFDYLLVYPDGREEGNETGAILLRSQSR